VLFFLHYSKITKSKSVSAYNYTPGCAKNSCAESQRIGMERSTVRTCKDEFNVFLVYIMCDGGLIEILIITSSITNV
jgi:hypothetical protein